nr:hypothetical protein [Tanacetum cinerariifolium]
MAISVILVSSGSSEDSVGTLAGRVILFGTIPTTIPDTTPVITPPTTQTDTTMIPTETPIIAPTIPPSLDYTPVSPDYSPASETESDPSEDPSSSHIPPLLAVSPFLSSNDDTTDSDTPDTPPSPTHGTSFTEITASTQRSPDIGYLADVEVGPRETSVKRVTHPAMPKDIPEPTHDGAVERHRIVGVESAVIALTERVAELERNNMRLRGTTSVESQRVDRL